MTKGLAALTAYIASIFAANWFIGNVGMCSPDGPCVIPVGFGLYAPSGVLWVGASLFLRDLVQNSLGWKWAIVGIAIGTGLSFLIASPFVAAASGIAFLLSELADFAVYTPLKAKRLPTTAVFASGVVGSVVDSAVFLLIAFGSLDFIAGQVVGKVEMTILAALLVAVRRRRDLSERRVSA
jgi:uncharacterized PurR-regulated membrane protein YhhQ (DUF165 family)